MFQLAQEELGMPRGTIKATVLIETLPAAFEMDEILYELREHSAGLNCGRWDYIFSFIKKLQADPAEVLPDRGQVTMDKGFLRAYSQLLIKTCHRRGVHAMGGMAAQIPIKDDPAANEAALAKVRADKEREAGDGHDGTWVAHPGAGAGGARRSSTRGCRARTRSRSAREDVQRQRGGPARGARGHAAPRRGCATTSTWASSTWRPGCGGTGCVPLYNLMEDAATAEIAAPQVWQWIHHRARRSTTARCSRRSCFREVLDEEMARIAQEGAGPALRRRRASSRRARSSSGCPPRPTFEEFLTLPAYEALLTLG